jgi:dTDP-4-amino-4,6-dideoxygalactose transaminase
MGGEEIRYVHDAFESNYIAPIGPQVDAFEKEFCEYTGFKHAVALVSGTAAMHLALINLGVKNGDEVFASTLTFIGSVSPVTFLGGTLVFIDSDKTSWNMDPDLLAQELQVCSRKGQLPKAVVPTDLYGQCVDYDRILAVCRQYNIPVVIDAAEAMGARYKSVGWVHAGLGADAAVFSFNGNKIMTTSGGGMLASNDKEFIEKAGYLARQARDDASHYEHSEIGFNYRISNIVAAIGRGQLKCLDDRVQRKRELYDYYFKTLSEIPGIEFMPEATYGRCNRWLSVILIDPDIFGSDREIIRLALEANNIESRPVWKPMHLQPVFNSNHGNGGKKQYPARVVGGEVSEDLFERGLCLPSGTMMTEGDLERVVDIILSCRTIC